MATAFIYNGFGNYEEKGDKVGTTIKWAGIDFFFPYGETTPIPDRVLREVDHAESTPAAGENGVLTYKLISVKGNYIADQMTAYQVPTTNSDRGLMVVQGKPTGRIIEVLAGYELEDGSPRMVEVSEKEATKAERDLAEKKASAYKEMVVGDYFQSKRQRMNGGQGRQYPDPQTRIYMEELGVIDNDDVTAHSKNTGLTITDVLALLEQQQKVTDVKAVDLHEAVDSVRKAGKAQVSPNARRSLGLAEKKAAWEAAHPEEVLVKE